MPIHFVSGDLFANRFAAQALAHGCNCQGSMGAGVATGFRDRYEEFVPEGNPLEKPTMPIVVESRRKKRATIERAWPGALVLEVTSKGEEPWVRFSPFFPHGGIPIPGSPGVFGRSVEGIWQGLKVFEHEDIDPSRWEIADRKGIKRAATSTRGKVRGHRLGVGGDVLLGYRDARHHIYLPAYRWVLEKRLAEQVARLREEASA
jgi:hypothetical protein